ncbi:MAG: FAD:protein FMN transferase [bacterium]
MRSKKLIILSVVVILIAAGIFLRNEVFQKDKIHRRTRFLMGTYCTIQAAGQRRHAITSIDHALDRMEEVDVKFNPINSQSEIYKFNTNKEPITDKEIIDLLAVSQQISRASSGAFDCSVQPLISLWGFYGDEPSLPEKKQVDECLKNVGFRNIRIVENKLVSSIDSSGIDLGGIAKGYAVGEAVKVLKKQGIKSALIDAGGDIYALGKLKNRGWKVGIRNPRGEGIIGAVEISDLAVVTSGDYEQYFEQDGLRYHHIFDPRTGYPARGLASVTVVSPDPTCADAWSTALFVLGEEKSMTIVENTPDLEAVIITNEGKIYHSSGLDDSFKITN